jgi:shikimate 5-dehydrogenase
MRSTRSTTCWRKVDSDVSYIEALTRKSKPTMYFIGVTTGKSAMMQVFPRWANVLGVDAELVGCDLPLNAPAADYRAVVSHIKHDEHSLGALVTTHKLDLLQAAHDLFDELDPYAQLTGEVSSISKCDGKLIGHAKDPISSGLAWEAFVPSGHFAQHEAHVLCLGGGGAAGATSVYAANLSATQGRPARFVIVDIDAGRLAHMRETHAKLPQLLNFEYVLNGSAEANDALMADLPAGSLVINATGLGKDRPGSPITDDAVFPENGMVWEFNYRGELTFLHQARAQQATRNLIIEDGWVYFLHGWSQVVAEVFHIDLTPTRFADLAAAAQSIRS